MIAIGSKVPDDHYEKLRWLAYRNRTTVSAIVAGYVSRCLPEEDLTGYVRPDAPAASGEPPG